MVAAGFAAFLEQPSPAQTVLAPDSLTGKTISGTVTNGLPVVVTLDFGATTFAQTGSVDDGTGDYTYTRTDPISAVIHMVKTAPPGVAGNISDTSLIFTSFTNGTFHSIFSDPDGYRGTNSGTFQLSSHVNQSPVVATGTATGVNSNSATLNGTVNPNGLVTTAWFDYGLTTAYGTRTNVTLSPIGGVTAQAVSVMLDGLQSGMTYHFRLTATNSDGAGIGSNATFVTLVSGAPPTIIIQPSSRTNGIGTTAIFTVTGTGTMPLAYQWRKDGVNLADGGNISGAASATINIAYVRGSDAGAFSAVITNAYGSVTSTLATLTVICPPMTLNPVTLPNANLGVSFAVTISSTNPARWIPTGSLHTGRDGHTATLLPSGKILVAGGSTNALTELYDPATGSWTETGGMNTARSAHRAVLLPNGKVLVAGGFDGANYIASAEIYDPATGNWSSTGAMTTPRCLHTATLLPNGKVLVAGGTGNIQWLSSAEIYDPAVGTWTATRNMTSARVWHTATLLPNGKVLLAGGTPGGYWTSGAELYDPATDTFAATGAMNAGRGMHMAVSLQDGRVLVFNGVGSMNLNLSSAELYSPATGSWTVTGGLSATRYNAGAAVLLLDGNVLVEGGQNGTNFISVTELYNPATGSWTVTSPLKIAHDGGAAVLLPDGRVLVAGGNSSSGILSAAELYDPAGGMTYSLTSGSLPGGLSLATNGVFSGIPTNSGVFSFTVTATDAYGCQGSRDYTITVLNSAQASAEVIAWGDNSFGQTNVPPGLSNVVAVAGGAFHSLALLAEGTVAAWGKNSSGQTDVPAGLSNVVAVAGGDEHSLALRADGTVAAWGDNTYGQTSVPVGLANVVAVAGGNGYSLTLRSDGSVAAWGSVGSNYVPAGLSNVRAIAAGGLHSLALQANGTVVAWGYNSQGQTNVPPGLSNVVAVAAGNFHSLALQADGHVVAWGDNGLHQTNVPAGLAHVVAVAGGGFHSLALRDDGTVAAWGNNWNGEIDVPTWLSNAVAVAAGSTTGRTPLGGHHSLALTGPAQPMIFHQPVSRTNESGTTAWFSVAVRGIARLTYQWQLNGTNLINAGSISGATNALLTINNVQPSDAGFYSVVIRNSFGTVQSQFAFLSVQPHTSDPIEGLVAYYPLNGNAEDASGNGNDGTMHGVVPAADRFGTATGACYFIGDSSFISAAADKMPSDNRTVSLWFKADRVDTEPGLFGYGGDGSGNSFFLGLNLRRQDAFVLSSHYDAYSLYVPYSTPPVNAWYHWVAVMDEAGSRFYLNGQMIGSRTGTTQTFVAGTMLSLGAIPDRFGAVPYTDANVGFFTGCLDEVRIYNRALSEPEIQWLYSRQAPGVDTQPQSRTNVVGSQATFSAVAHGAQPLSYQWLFNGTKLMDSGNLSGATTSTLTITGVQLGDAGSYSVLITNTFGSVTSSVAVLTVQNSTVPDKDLFGLADPTFANLRFTAKRYPGYCRSDGRGGLLWSFANGYDLDGANDFRTGGLVRTDEKGTPDANFVVGPALRETLGTAIQSDGKILVSGRMVADVATNGAPNWRVLRLLTNGVVDAAYTSPVFDSCPRFMAVQADDRLLVTSGSTVATGNGGITQTVRLGTNGSLDGSFISPVFQGSYGVFAPPVFDTNGMIYLAGGFTQVNGQPRGGIARLFPNGSLDSSFVPAGFTFSLFIRGIILQQNGRVVIGGRLSTNLSYPYSYFPLLRLNSDGSLDTSFKVVTVDSIGFTRARLLRSTADGKILAVSHSMARFNSDGSLDSSFTRLPFGNALGALDPMLECFWFEQLGDGTLVIPADPTYAYGPTTIGGQPFDGSVRLSPNGILGLNYTPPSFQQDSFPTKVVRQDDGRLLVAGDYDRVAGTPKAGLARLAANGVLDMTFNMGVSNVSAVLSLAQLPGGATYALLQRSDTAAGTSSNLLVRLTSNGEPDPHFNVPTVFVNAGGYRDLVLQGERPLISGPDAQSVVNGNVPAARFLTNGTLDSSFSPALGSPGAVFRYANGYIRTIVAGDFQLLATLTNGQLLVATTVGPYAENMVQFTYQILRLNPDGAPDASYSPVTFSPAVTSWNYPYLSDPQMNDYGQFATLQPIRPIAGASVRPDGKTFVWGSFSSLNGVARPGVACLSPGGALVSGFPVGTGSLIGGESARPARLSSVTFDPSGKIWMTGDFTQWDGVNAQGYVRLNPDGTVDLSCQPKCSYYAVADYDRADFSTAIAGGWNDAYVFGSHRLPSDVWARAMTRLTDYVVPLQFIKASLSVYGGSFQMQLDGTPGATVVVDTSLNMVTWTPWKTNLLPAGGLKLGMPTGANQLFFRARIPQ